MATLPCSPSFSQIGAEQADNLDRLRPTLNAMNLKDLVPQLVARNVLKSYEMRSVYEKQSPEDQVEVLIQLLKTKNYWLGPLTDALIRNGQATVARALLQMQQNN